MTHLFFYAKTKKQEQQKGLAGLEQVQRQLSSYSSQFLSLVVLSIFREITVH
jgi:hypothetical protein